MQDPVVTLPAGAPPLVRKAAALLCRGLRERGIQAGPECALSLALDPALGPEAFRIETRPGAVQVAGGDPCGVLYGAGKLLRWADVSGGRLRGCRWQGRSAPARTVRGVYFATHFHNVYHDAPVQEIIRYVEDLALWGCNALSVWFDMHHYRGTDDPAAQAMAARLRAILEAAQAVGMRPGLTTLANEGFSSTPDPLRADWTAGHDGYFREPGGHYHCEICPSRPGGLELILELRRQVLDAFAGIDLGYIWLWPYDQGGCTCAACAPWGTNGFLRTAEALLPLLHDRFPNARTILSTWYFDHFVRGEWEGLSRRLAEGPMPGVDYLLIDDFGGFPEYPLRHGIPGGLPAVGFPEISMEGNGPWGGYGANPRPGHWSRYWAQAGPLLQGSFPYSEGIYEDINKVLILQFEWDPGRPAGDILAEYGRGCFGEPAAEVVPRVAAWMEEDGALHAVGGPEGPAIRSGPMPRAEACLAELDALAARLPSWALASWRWRLLWLRAAIGAEIRRSRGVVTDRLDAYFEELAAIYHAGLAEAPVSPPSRRAWRRLRGG